MMHARDELIQMQQRWVKELKQQIYDATGRNSPELDRYYDDYRGQFRGGFERVATRDELVRQLARADIAYFGDFHTLRITQKTMARLLLQVVEEHGRALVLGLEMLHTRHQGAVDDYLEGKLDEEQFLAAIDYARTWGFPWPNYRALFELARERRFKIVALNVEPSKKKGALAQRDAHAATLIAAASMMYPNSLVAVLYGDLHLAENHIPAKVKQCLKAHMLERKHLLVYANSETFYWILAKQGKEHVVDVVRMGKGVYCIMNATPLVKFQSWVNWQESGEELEFTGLDSLGHEFHGQTDLSHQFASMLARIAGFLKIEHEDLDDFELYTTGDLDFLDELREQGIYSAEEIERLRETIAHAHTALFHRARIIYLGNLSTNAAAEAATKFLHFVCLGNKFEVRHSHRDTFYELAFDEALAMLGVLLINPRFRVATIADHTERVEALKRRRKLSADERMQREVSDMVVAHAAMVLRMIKQDRKQVSLRAVYELPPDRFRRVVRALGAVLGAQMYHAMRSDELSVEEVRAFFYRVWKPGEALEHYVALKKRFLSLLPQLRNLRESL